MVFNLAIEGSYLCQFDTKKGNTLIDYKSGGSNNVFEDIEYLSLPAGLHDLSAPSDTVKFQILSKNGARFLSICRVYNNSKDIADKSTTVIDRSKIKIYSLGAIFGLEHKEDVDTLILYEESIIKSIDICFKEFLKTQKADIATTKILESLANKSLLEESSSWKEPYRLLQSIDCLIFPLWKELILKKKILIINNEPTKVGFDELNKLVEYLKFISDYGDYDIVYNTVLTNFETVLLKNKASYIAYTTDAIIKDSTGSYDVLLEIHKNRGITLHDNKGNPLHATFVESLKLITKFKDDSAKFDGKSKTQKLIDFFYFIFTFNNLKPGYYKFIEKAVDIPLQAPLERQRFEKWLVSLNSGLESLLKSEKHYNNKSKILILKPSDVLTLGFDGFNKNDLEFVKKYVEVAQLSQEISGIDFVNFDFNLFI